MAAFGGLTLTTRGLALQAKVQAGTPLQFNRIAIGDGQITNQTVTALNALLSQKLNLTLMGTVAKPPNRATVSGKLTNSTISAGFYFREIGLFAQDPVDGEILYAYGNSGASAEFIPPGGGADILERLIELDVIVGSTANISATIDSSLVFVTQKDFSSHTHDGTTGNGPKITSSGLAAGAVTDAIIGNRTVSDATAPTGDTGTPTMLFGWLANMVKAITGKSSWRTAPAISLEATKSHVDATASVHGAVSSATANRIIQRDANGRAQVAAPVAAGDIARKAEVDVAMSRADQAFQSASDGKRLVAAAITGMGQAAEPTDSFSELATKVSNISKDATASEMDVLAGKTFYQSGKRTGSMSLKPFSNSPVNITADGTGYLRARMLPGAYLSTENRDGMMTWEIVMNDPDFIASNIRSGVEILGVSGTLVEGKRFSQGTAAAKNPIYWNPGYGKVVEVTGLGFQPTFVFAWGGEEAYNELGRSIVIYSSLYTYHGVYHALRKDFDGGGELFFNPGDVVNNQTTYVNNTGFRLPVYSLRDIKDYNWIAFG